MPAINVRMLAYDTARAVFRAARAGKAGAILLEIARSEIAYTDQRPAEYVAVLIGAALREGYVLPLFIQGDHCQVNQKKYQADPEGEVGEVKKLIAEEIGAGFYNIDVDTSTLVDLSQATLEEQQRLNYERAAEITAFIRAHEPDGRHRLRRRGDRRSGHEEQHRRGAARLHAGVQPRAGRRGGELDGHQQDLGADGHVARRGGAARRLDRRREARPPGARRALQGGARGVRAGRARCSTAPARCRSNAFGNFPRIETAEIHLATNFQNIVFDHPEASRPTCAIALRRWVDENAAGERKSGDTAEQFYYKARKKAIGPFKREMLVA